MLTTKEKEKRDKMEARIKRLKYLLYQAEIQFASHDNSRLKETSKKISFNAKRLSEMLTKKKKTFKKKVVRKWIKK